VRGFLLCAPENAGWRHRLTVPTIVKTLLTMVLL